LGARAEFTDLFKDVEFADFYEADGSGPGDGEGDDKKRD